MKPVDERTSEKAFQITAKDGKSAVEPGLTQISPP
jgi:hypothetical protein